MSNGNRSLYNCIDSAVTFKVWQALQEELTADSPGYHNVYRQTMALYGPTIFMSTRGLKLDLERLEVEKLRVRDLIAAKQIELDELTGGLNPHSPKQCQQYFYGTLGLQPYTKDNKITTDDKAMARIARRGYPAAALVQEIRRLNKLASTYLDVRTDPDGRIRASWNLRGTKEGRLSSSENLFGTGLNFQNLHPQFKNFIVADPGMIFIEIDKKQAEWVVVAYLSGDARMLEVIESGVDPHLYTAGLITGAPLDLLTQEAKIIGHNTDPDIIFQLRTERLPQLLEAASFLPRTMSCRQAGKKGNHGLNYREGVVMFALTNEITETDARPIVLGYRSGYCNIPIWWDQTEKELRAQNRVLYNCFGRPRRFLGEWNQILQTAIAYKPQSTVVDLVNRGMTAIYNDPAPYMTPHQLGAQVHDSILFQFPVADLEAMAAFCLGCHRHLDPELSYFGRRFHIGSELKIGFNWGAYDPDLNPTGMSEVHFPQPLGALRKSLGDIVNAKLERLA